MAFLYQMLGSKLYPPKDPKADFRDKTILVTGANTGLGFEAALKLAQSNAKCIIMGVRTVARGEEAKQEILSRVSSTADPGRKEVIIHVWPLDMLDYDSVQTFADRVNAEVNRLDYVILNAGVNPHTFKKSKYGFEMGLQINLMSTTLLALLLLPKLKASRTSYFVPVLELVGSGTHARMSDLLPGTDDPERDQVQVYNTQEFFDTFGFVQQYSLTKLYLMYVQENLVRLTRDHAGRTYTYVVVVGPGPTHSGLGRDMQEQPAHIRAAFYLFSAMMKTAEQGSRTLVSALVQGDRVHGKFWQWDTIERPAKWCSDEHHDQRSKRVWESIIASLDSAVPGCSRRAACDNTR